MIDLNKLVERYLDSADTIRERIDAMQRSVNAANSVGMQILSHPEFADMPASMQEQFRGSQVSVAEMMARFEVTQ